MSKAVLVIDIPENCLECKCYDLVNCACKAFEMAGEEDIYECPDEGESKPDWCPLHPLPEKKEISGCSTFTDLGFVSGFNACIDEMVGDNNRNT